MLFGFASSQSINDGVGNAYLGMVAAEHCSTCPDNINIHYVIRYMGTGTELANFVYSPAQIAQFLKQYRKLEKNLTDPVLMEIHTVTVQVI